MREQSSSLIGEMDHHRGSRIFLAGSWATSSQIECEPAIELCCLLGIYAQLVYVRMQASRPTVARMFGWEKLPKLSRQAFFERHRNFCRIQKSAHHVCAFCYFACWILKTKRRETSDVADFHRESARKGRVAAENRRSFIYCGGRQVAEAGLVRSIFSDNRSFVKHFPTQPNHQIQIRP